MKELQISPTDSPDQDFERFLEEGWQSKLTHYADKYQMHPEDIIPLAFDSFGGTHPKTLAFLHSVSEVMAQKDKVLTDKIFWYFRNKIAVSIAFAQFSIHQRLRRLQPEAHRRVN